MILPLSATPLDNGATFEQLHVLQFLNGRIGHITFPPSRGKIRNFLDIKLGLVLLGSHLSVTSKNLSSGAKRGANERQTEQGNTLRSLDLKMAAAKKRKGRNPKNYRTVK